MNNLRVFAVVLPVALSGCVTLTENDLAMMSDKKICEKREYIVNTPITKYDEETEALVLKEVSNRGIDNCDTAHLVCARELKLKVGTKEYTQCHLNIREQEAKRIKEQAQIDAKKEELRLQQQRAYQDQLLNSNNQENTNCHFSGNNMRCTSY